MINCILQFYDEWEDFRVTELRSLLQLFNLPDLTFEQLNLKDCYMIINFPSEEIIQSICNRSVLIRLVAELWTYDTNFNRLLEKTHKLSSKTWTKYYEFNESISWSLNIDAFCKTYTPDDKEYCRKYFDFLKFPGPVKVVNPDIDMILLLDHSQSNSFIGDEDSNIPCYFGRVISRGGMRSEIKKYDLKKRLYVGPTSLDHSLALIMANLSNIKQGSLVFDPFVGTGSILISLSHFGAICTGFDIDSRVLHGEMYAGHGDRSIKRNIYENFKSYNLPLPELIRMDNHLLDRHMKSYEGIFDCIVTDPPYGIRAGARKSGRKDPVQIERREDHIPTTQIYAVEEVMLDLLHSAARFLVLGGRLSYLIPTTYDFSIDDLPTHPCLQIKYLCCQPLSSRHGRHCVVMEKLLPYTKEYENQFTIYKDEILSSNSNHGFAKLKGKLEQALSVEGIYNDNVIKNISNSAIKRRNAKERRKEFKIESMKLESKELNL